MVTEIIEATEKKDNNNNEKQQRYSAHAVDDDKKMTTMLGCPYDDQKIYEVKLLMAIGREKRASDGVCDGESGLERERRSEWVSE